MLLSSACDTANRFLCAIVPMPVQRPQQHILWQFENSLFETHHILFLSILRKQRLLFPLIHHIIGLQKPFGDCKCVVCNAFQMLIAKLPKSINYLLQGRNQITVTFSYQSKGLKTYFCDLIGGTTTAQKLPLISG